MCGKWIKEETDRFSWAEVGGEGETEGNVSAGSVRWGGR